MLARALLSFVQLILIVCLLVEGLHDPASRPLLKVGWDLCFRCKIAAA